jgi:hypothetical protein
MSLAFELLPVIRTRANRRGYITGPYLWPETHRIGSQTILKISFQFSIHIPAWRRARLNRYGRPQHYDTAGQFQLQMD